MDNEDKIALAAAYLKKGELVAIPTETVYGLAGNALDAEVVAKIFQVKNRPTFDPLIVHTYHITQIQNFILHLPAKAKLLADKFWPGALTLLLPKKNIIPDLVTAGLDTVAIRIPNHPLTLELLKRLDFPLAAPSANPFGYISPTSALHVQNQLGDKIAYILDGGNSTIGIESTIVGFQGDEATIYRLGGIAVEQIEEIIGEVHIQTHSSSNPKASGMLQSHYAPKKPLVIQDFSKPFLKTIEISKDKIGILSFDKYISEIPQNHQVILSTKSNFKEAAQHLFAGMRYLDDLPIEIIFAELLPEVDLGRAINDRIRRAALK